MSAKSHPNVTLSGLKLSKNLKPSNTCLFIIFEKVHKTEMGQKLSVSLSDPDLCNGMTCACFHKSGKHPFLILLIMSSDRGRATM